MSSGNKIPQAALFSSFLMGLVSAALIEMGVLEDPTTKKKRQDKDAASQHIDMLCVLRDKTRGNLDTHEKELLDRAISDLQIEFAKLFKGDSK
ncbi:MAG TPA: DUF1844 domain-containing protein [Bdellovibrionota bacterium]|jgi:hypothetical protein|nr:DUF1844 domain-containing protein [Bdellovibrionota bacterium]